VPAAALPPFPVVPAEPPPEPPEPVDLLLLPHPLVVSTARPAKSNAINKGRRVMKTGYQSRTELPILENPKR
jgi:hypothetical protein